MAKAKEEPVKKKRIPRQKLYPVLVWIAEIAAALLLAYGVSRAFFTSVTLQENSMAPTIEAGDTVLINRLAFRTRKIRRGELIAYRNGDKLDSSIHVKRVIGLPGETVQITGGAVYINGEKLDESAYGFDAILNGGLAEEQIVLDDDEYFVLGDNRNGSGDSRYTDIGNVGRENIIGTVWFRVWPFPKTGKIR